MMMKATKLGWVGLGPLSEQGRAEQGQSRVGAGQEQGSSKAGAEKNYCKIRAGAEARQAQEQIRHRSKKLAAAP